MMMGPRVISDSPPSPVAWAEACDIWGGAGLESRCHQRITGTRGGGPAALPVPWTSTKPHANLHELSVPAPGPCS